MNRTALCIAAALVLAIVVSSAVHVIGQEGETKSKHSIKDVMKRAHKGGLLEKVLKGDATQEDKLELLDHYVSLTENKPPKGEAESWADKTNAVVVAAAKVVVDRDDGSELLKKATNCMACHSNHKGG